MAQTYIAPEAAVDAADEAIIAALQQSIDDARQLYIYADAIFYAERLFDLVPDYQRLHTLAQCYQQSGDPHTAYRLLQSYYPFLANCPSPSNPSVSLYKNTDHHNTSHNYTTGSGSTIHNANVSNMAGMPTWSDYDSMNSSTTTTPNRRIRSRTVIGNEEYGHSQQQQQQQQQQRIHSGISASAGTRTLVSDSPSCWECQYLLGVCCCQTHREREGVTVLEELLRYGELTRAQQQLQQQQQQQQQRECSSYSHHDRYWCPTLSRMAAVRYWLGRCLRPVHMFNALDFYQDAVRDDPRRLAAFDAFTQLCGRQNETCLQPYYVMRPAPKPFPRATAATATTTGASATAAAVTWMDGSGRDGVARPARVTPQPIRSYRRTHNAATSNYTSSNNNTSSSSNRCGNVVVENSASSNSRNYPCRTSQCGRFDCEDDEEERQSSSLLSQQQQQQQQHSAWQHEQSETWHEAIGHATRPTVSSLLEGHDTSLQAHQQLSVLLPLLYRYAQVMYLMHTYHWAGAQKCLRSMPNRTVNANAAASSYATPSTLTTGYGAHETRGTVGAHNHSSSHCDISSSRADRAAAHTMSNSNSSSGRVWSKTSQYKVLSNNTDSGNHHHVRGGNDRIAHGGSSYDLVGTACERRGLWVRDSAWSLAQLALAYFHDGNMQDCATTSAQLLHHFSWRLNEPALIYYSTALWQLRDEGTLGALARRLLRDMPQSPITYCVAANMYSLAKEPKEALVMLRRAVQLNASLAYAHALCGYELLSLNQLTEASEAFHRAIAADGNLYVAYAGMGEVEVRRENIDAARGYFRQALARNSLPAIVNRYAVTFHRRGASREELEEALYIYNRSLDRHPHNLAARLQRGTVLLRLGRCQEAEQEMLALLPECDDEALIYVTLARCMQLRHRPKEAIRYYTKAMTLDPRRESYIRGCIERLAQEDHEACST